MSRREVWCCPDGCYAGGDESTLLHSYETAMMNWRCKDSLQSLKLVLQYTEAIPRLLTDVVQDSSTVDDSNRARFSIYQFQKRRFYDQINRLKLLEELTLGYDVSLIAHQSPSLPPDVALRGAFPEVENMNRKEHQRALDLKMDDFTLPMGLSRLTALKRLKKLSLVGDFWTLMGQEEVEFMHAHWKLLGSIEFSIEDKETFRGVIGCSHWVWLKQQRPELRYLASYM